jgi:ribosomal protein S18 acetylase RimI-like enzyme
MTCAESDDLIRAATMQDLEDIRGLLDLLRRTEYEEGYDPTIDLAWIFSAEATHRLAQSISGPDGVALVATSDDQVVGCLLGGLRPGEHEATGGVEGLFVLPAHRSKGFGSGLMTRFLDWCAAQDLQRVSLAVAPANAPAIALYEKMGFVTVNDSPEESPRVPTLIMERRERYSRGRLPQRRGQAQDLER